MSDDVCVSCLRNAPCHGDVLCSPCGGKFHCDDDRCLAPGCSIGERNRARQEEDRERKERRP